MSPKFAANSGERLSQVRFRAVRVAERRIKNGLHLASALVLRHARICKKRSIRDEETKVQRLITNAIAIGFGNVRKLDTSEGIANALPAVRTRRWSATDLQAPR
jgi:hypothetical protein